jgi:hypothetical protein
VRRIRRARGQDRHEGGHDEHEAEPLPHRNLVIGDERSIRSTLSRDSTRRQHTAAARRLVR